MWEGAQPVTHQARMERFEATTAMRQLGHNHRSPPCNLHINSNHRPVGAEQEWETRQALGQTRRCGLHA